LAKFYRFQIYDGTNIFNTTDVSGPTINPDDAVVEYVRGNNSFVNRSGSSSTPFIIRINDTTRGNIPVSAGFESKFFVTYDGINLRRI